MTNYHWKHGQGFAIRYGGPEGIRWFNTPPADLGGAPIPSVGLGAMEPIGMAIEAAKAAGLLLQWWEMRKQTLLQAAAFEERRVPWLMDMLLLWAAEVQEGQVRLDTITYFDREVSRFLEVIRENQRIDVPSTLLLQIERTALAMVRINRTLSTIVEDGVSRPNFVLEGEKIPFRYQPFAALVGDVSATERYLASCEVASERSLAAATSPLGPVGNAVLATVLLGPLGALAFWKFSDYLAASTKAKEQKRAQEFQAMSALALELRSCRTLLTIVSVRPETLREIALPDSMLLEEHHGGADFSPRFPD